MNSVMSIKETAGMFLDACATGKGWEGCKQFCHEGATSSAQADALVGIDTLEALTDWMKGLLVPIPKGRYEVRCFAVDHDRNNVTVSGVFRGSHTGEGGPAPPTGKRIETESVFVVQAEGDKVRHMTKIWNDGFALKQLAWA